MTTNAAAEIVEYYAKRAGADEFAIDSKRGTLQFVLLDIQAVSDVALRLLLTRMQKLSFWSGLQVRYTSATSERTYGYRDYQIR